MRTSVPRARSLRSLRPLVVAALAVAAAPVAERRRADAPSGASGASGVSRVPAVPAPREADTLSLPALRAPVELVRDTSGIVHIRARNEHDLFVAQGWSVARDRLFQLEHWRRLATGTMAEVVGARGVAVDESARLLRYRGDVDADLAWYHPRGKAIVEAFVAGINAYVDAANRDTTLLPPEFAMLGIRPGRWTPAVVISRHNGLFGNADGEVRTACEVRAFGDSALRRRRGYGPPDPMLRGDTAVDYGAIPAAVLARYRADQRFRYRPEDLRPADRRPGAPAPAGPAAAPAGALACDGMPRTADARDALAPPVPGDLAALDGSNNWAVSGARSASGRPLVANDPHRAITTPSLRYLVHLEAPGWNVIGGGEPALPGVAIGRNAHAAWGLTIFSMDMEDLVVLRLAPGDADASVEPDGRTVRFRLERDTIRVRDAAPVVVTHRFSAHGPVLHVDTARGLAYALRAAWLERGTAPYLASLRLDQATTWAAFKAGLGFARAPALNWVYGDVRGTIAWQVAGIAPIRRGFSGLVPVSPRFGWQGFLDIAALPGAVDPARGVVHSANEYNVPARYPHLAAITPSGWAEPWRAQRIAEVLDTTRRATLEAMARLQHDDTDLAARHVLRLLRRCRVTAPAAGAGADDADGPMARVAYGYRFLDAWDGRADALQVAPLVYRGFEAALRRALGPPAPTLERLPALVEQRAPGDPTCGGLVRDALAAGAALALRREPGDGAGPARLTGGALTWRRYGDWHVTSAEHPFAQAASDSVLARLQPPPFPRGGSGNTPFATGDAAVQRHGASLRVVFDLVHPDSSHVTSTPGQSGDPRSPYFANLYLPWVRGEYAPLPMTRAAVDRRAASVTVLRPPSAAPPR